MEGVLAIDLGASSGRCIVSSYEEGKISLHEISRFDNYVIHDKENLHWNIDLIFKEILHGIKKAEDSGFKYDSIAVDTWGVDFGLLDKKGQLIENPIHYRDKRTTGSFEKVKKFITPWELYHKTGLQIMEINTLFQLFTIKNDQPETYEHIDKVLLMPDLINYLLTGEIKSERTIASTTQLYNPQKKDWDYELIEMLELDPSFFSEIIDPGTEVGFLKQSIVEELQIKNKKVIAVGSHDTASAIVTTPYEKENLFLSSGTWSLIGTQLEAPIISETTYKHNLSNESGVNDKITLLKNITGLWLIQETKKQFEKEGKNYSFSDLADIARHAKPINCFFDTDLAELTVPGDIPRRIRMIAKKTSQTIPDSDGEIVRVIYENLALKYREAYEEIVSSVGYTFNSIYIVGGGANADFLSECTANALNLKAVAGYTEATALGNTLVQLLALGKISSLAESENILADSFQTNTFSPMDQKVWEEKYNKYKKIIGSR